METRIILENYIREYYANWLRCSQQWCEWNGIPQEAYDLLADVLETLCRRPDTQLLDMLAHEKVGDPKLFFYVRKTLRYKILDYRFNRYQFKYPLCRFADVQYSDDQTEISNELFDAFRVEEAKFRSDDFIDIHRQYGGTGRLTRFVTHAKTKYGVRTVVRYQTITEDGHCRQFGRRTSAIEFLANQNAEAKTGKEVCR